MNYLVKFFKTLPIGLAIVAILLVIIVLLSLTGVTTMWPTFFCIFYFTTFAEMNIKRVPALIVSGVLGLFGGFITMLVPGTAGTILLLVWLLLLLTAGIMSDPGMPLIEGPFVFLMLTVATAVPNICAATSAASIWIGYAAGIVLMVVIGLIMAAVAKKTAAKAESTEDSA